MCHGAGAWLGTSASGEDRRALVILGSLVLFVEPVPRGLGRHPVQCFPPVILGVILLFGGLELQPGGGAGEQQGGPLHHLPDGRLAMWNMGVAYLVGLLLVIACERKWVRL